MKHLDNILELADHFEVFIFDHFGVLWDGNTFYPGVLDALRELQVLGKKVALLSNATMLSSFARQRYATHGLLEGKHYNFFVTSGDVARQMLQSRQIPRFPLPANDTLKYYTLGRPYPELFAGLSMFPTDSIQEAHLGYLGVVEKDGAPTRSAESFLPQLEQCLRHRLPLFCANPDYFCIVKKEAIACQGLLAKAYEEMGGTVQWCGKPYPEIFHACLDLIAPAHPPLSKIAMVGDTVRTDIKGGNDVGFQTVLVLKTGMTYDQMQGGHSLHQICEEGGAQPTYTLNQVAKTAKQAIIPSLA